MSSASPLWVLTAAQDALQSSLNDAAARLRAVPGVGTGNMGLTPDDVKFSPPYQSARKAYEAAFQALRVFNGKHAKQLRAINNGRRI